MDDGKAEVAAGLEDAPGLPDRAGVVVDVL